MVVDTHLNGFSPQSSKCSSWKKFQLAFYYNSIYTVIYGFLMVLKYCFDYFSSSKFVFNRSASRK